VIGRATVKVWCRPVSLAAGDVLDVLGTRGSQSDEKAVTTLAGRG
jgi:hypothetical protein